MKSNERERQPKLISASETDNNCGKPLLQKKKKQSIHSNQKQQRRSQFLTNSDSVLKDFKCKKESCKEQQFIYEYLH